MSTVAVKHLFGLNETKFPRINAIQFFIQFGFQRLALNLTAPDQRRIYPSVPANFIHFPQEY